MIHNTVMLYSILIHLFIFERFVASFFSILISSSSDRRDPDAPSTPLSATDSCGVGVNKRPRYDDPIALEGGNVDLPQSRVAEVLASITDPRKLLGPEVLFSENSARDEAAKVNV